MMAARKYRKCMYMVKKAAGLIKSRELNKKELLANGFHRGTLRDPRKLNIDLDNQAFFSAFPRSLW
jgi:hypothetical protein